MLIPHLDTQVEAKKAMTRASQLTSGPANAGRGFGGPGHYRSKKIFVGGLPSTLTDDQFRQYFEKYGDVTDAVIMFDQNTNRPRGFGFISFDTEDAVDRVMEKNFHELNNKLVEVKRALPKDANLGGGGGGGGGGRSGGYQGYGSSSASANTFDSQMDGNRFGQPQTTGSGYPPYTGYGQPSYGYGAANSTLPYGGYGIGGYGSTNTGFGGPAGAYGNPSNPNTGYVSGPPSALKSSWASQAPGYGAAGYSASAGYGNTVPVSWSAPGSGGAGSAPMGQSPSGASGYGNQGYGYGNYGGSEGPYNNSSGYGSVGGRAGNAPNSNAGGGDEQQGMGGGYMGNVYGGNGSSGY